MNFKALLKLVGDEPVFGTTLLLAGDVSPSAIRVQLSRWIVSGRLIQLRRGLYALAPPFQKILPHSFLIGNRMVRASYVLIYSQPNGDSPAYLQELRLQNLERLNGDELQRQAAEFNSPKLKRAAQCIRELAAAETYEAL